MDDSAVGSPLHENPVFIGLVGLCPALFVTTQVSQSVVLGLCTLAVLVAAAPLLGIIDMHISGRSRFLTSLAVIAALTTVVEILLGIVYPEMRARLGVFVPLIAVNCLVLRLIGGSETGNGPGEVTLAAVYTGLSFLVALSLIAGVREILGTGGISWGQVAVQVPGLAPVQLFGTAAGALLVLGYIRALIAYLRLNRESREAGR
ncbi:MAG: Rnf-Nqr domain containing protein [Spirochaetia bacterium]